MRTIEVDDEVWEALQELATPLVDTPSTVLRRLLKGASNPRQVQTPGVEHDSRDALSVAAGEQVAPVMDLRREGFARFGGRVHDPKKRRRPKRGETIPQADYERPLIQALQEKGGWATTQSALTSVRALMEPRFQPLDLEELRPGLPRWQSRIHFARSDLVKGGIIANNSHRGIWELTEKGMALDLCELDEPPEPQWQHADDPLPEASEPPQTPS